MRVPSRQFFSGVAFLSCIALAYWVGGLDEFTLKQAVPISPRPIGDSAPTVLGAEAKASGEDGHKTGARPLGQDRLQETVAELRAENAELARLNRELDEKLTATTGVGDGHVADLGLDPEYVKDLEAPGLSRNLVVTGEGQVRHQLTNKEVRQLNARLRGLLDEFKILGKENAYIESESENGYVLKVPPLDSPEEFERTVEGLFQEILGSERGSRFFNSNRRSMDRPLRGLGRYERTLTVEFNAARDEYSLRDDIVDPESGGHYGGTYPSLSAETIPPEVEHLLEIVN